MGQPGFVYEAVAVDDDKNVTVTTVEETFEASDDTGSGTKRK